MEGLSREMVEMRLRERQTPNERAVQHLRRECEENLTFRVTLAHDAFNDDIASIEILTNYLPEITLTTDVRSHRSIKSTSYLFSSNNEILESGPDDTFFLRARVFMRRRLGYVPGNDRAVHISTSRGGNFYMEKPISIKRDITEVEETAEGIFFPPIPEHLHGLSEEDYVHEVYRDRHGRIINYSRIMKDAENGDEEISVQHFAGVPWKIRLRYEGKYTNAIFENLHTNEVRRYIINGIVSHFVMLDNEMYALHKRGGILSLLRCSTGEDKIVCDRYFSTILNCYTASTYAVVSHGTANGHCFFTIIYTTEEAPLA